MVINKTIIVYFYSSHDIIKEKLHFAHMWFALKIQIYPCF